MSDRTDGDPELRLAHLERQMADLRGAQVASDRRVRALELELRALAERLPAPAPEQELPLAHERRPLRPDVPPVAPPPPVELPPAPVRPAPLPPRRVAPPPRPPREIDWSQLFGARALAWAGGIVTSLGVVFLYALAANRGWIGPVARVATGAAASAVLFAAGYWLRRRFGTTYAALTAAGAGIVGGYATLLASVALYSLLPAAAALLVAAAIAALGLATALRWSAETVAALGLVGAILVPLVGVLDLGWTVLGTGFVLVVLVAAVVVAALRGWAGVLAVASAASAPQIAALVAERREGNLALVVLAALFALVYLAAAALWSRRATQLDGLAASLALVSAAVASLGAQVLFDDGARGVASFAAAAAYAVAAGGLVAADRARSRDLSSLLGAIALSLAAVGLAQAASGQVLAIAWAAQAAVLAWLARRIDEERYQLMALVYLGLSAGHVLEVDAPPPVDFWAASGDPAAGAPSVLALAAGALALAWYARPWPPDPRPAGGVLAALAPAFAALRASQRGLRVTALAAAAAAALYGGSLGILGAAQLLATDVALAFQRGHAVVTVAWAVLALGVLVTALRRGKRPAARGALALYAAVVGKLFLFDVVELGETPRSLALLAGAACLALGAVSWQRLAVAGARLDWAGALLLAASVAAAVPGAVEFADGNLAALDLDALALVALAVAYGGLAAVVFGRERDLSSALALVAVALAAVGAAVQFDGNALALAWAVLAAALAALASRTREPRLLFASAVVTVLAAAHALVVDAPPRDLFAAQPHPGAGVPALLAAVGAGLAFAVFAVARRTPSAPEGDDPFGTRAVAFRLESALPRFRAAALAGASLVAGFAVSLAVLELFQVVSGADVETAFQRGHTAVSAIWAVLALALLYTGLVRRVDVLRNAGLALFGLALAKIFVYDLAALSAFARAMSFLAVGALLLAAGFFYQRLSNRLDGREASAQ